MSDFLSNQKKGSMRRRGTSVPNGILSNHETGDDTIAIIPIRAIRTWEGG